MNTPNYTRDYVKSLLKPAIRQDKRNVWSIDLQTVWLPFFTSTNAMGDSAIPNEALGCPLRLAYDEAGAVKFSKTGKPVIRVVKDIAENVKLVKDNLVANLMAYTGDTINGNPDGYKAQVELSRLAGMPIARHDKAELNTALQSRAVAQAEAIAREAEAIANKAEAKTEAEAELVPA